MGSPIPSVMAARPAAQVPAAAQQLSLVADLGLAAAAAPQALEAREPEDGGEPGFDDQQLSADAAARPRPRRSRCSSAFWHQHPAGRGAKSEKWTWFEAPVLFFRG